MTAGRDWTADAEALHLSRRRVSTSPAGSRSRTRRSPGSISRPASIRIPYPLPDLARRAVVSAARERSAGRARGRGGRPLWRARRNGGRGARARRRSSSALARIFPRGASACSAPTYSGHKAASRAAGAQVDAGERLEDYGRPRRRHRRQSQQPGRADHAARRPRRTSQAPGAARRLADRRRSLRRFRRRESKASRRSCPGKAVVLRRSASLRPRRACVSALLSLRPTSSSPLRAALGEWPVSGPAIAIGTKALADLAWTDAMRDRLGREAARLDGLLEGNGWRILGGTRLFRLAAKADARAAFERLMAAGILAPAVRRCARLAAVRDPGDESAWRRLAGALAG